MSGVLQFIAACVAGVLIVAAPLQAQTNPLSQEPQLRIDPGMRTAVIRRIGVDASCKLLATGSEDKTGAVLETARGHTRQHAAPPDRSRQCEPIYQRRTAIREMASRGGAAGARWWR